MIEATIIIFCLVITFLAGIGYKELAEGITKKIKNKQSLMDQKEYFKIYDDKCKSMAKLPDETFEKWVQLEYEIKRKKRESRSSLRSIG